jgi:hypothetical protein
MPAFSGVPNPLFGIVSTGYVQGFNSQELRVMLRTIGRIMGLRFSQDAVEYLLGHYGGHPVLTRQACSWTHKSLQRSEETRPVEITHNMLLRLQNMRDSDLAPYYGYVLEELKQLYPDEYEMLELLASHSVADFMELDGNEGYTRHLTAYGLLTRDSNGIPRISIPSIAGFVGREFARRERRNTVMRVVPTNERGEWVARRVDGIISNIRSFEILTRSQTSTLSLFGPNSFPEAERFAKIGACETEDDFAVFINACHRCFVESIRNYGKSVGGGRYYDGKIRQAYPTLFHALERIRLYRHDHMHLALNPKTQAALAEYLSADLEGRQPSEVPDRHFTLQQCVLESLTTAVMIETDRLAQAEGDLRTN